jgi:hypothetical protein
MNTDVDYFQIQIDTNRWKRDETNVTKWRRFAAPAFVVCADMTHSPWENPTHLNTRETTFCILWVGMQLTKRNGSNGEDLASVRLAGSHMETYVNQTCQTRTHPRCYLHYVVQKARLSNVRRPWIISSLVWYG